MPKGEEAVITNNKRKVSTSDDNIKKPKSIITNTTEEGKEQQESTDKKETTTSTTMASTTESDNTKKNTLPITLLGGFLGAGKTSLLKHILERKFVEEQGEFKCAVIVNDVAELNIDKSLIDQTSLAHSDDVIAMQNGCVCCSLQNDLIAQIIKMATSSETKYNYMIIEASGISEPAAIAKLFEDCDDENHDHKEGEEEHVLLKDVARLDTCVTVVDASEFLANFETVVPGENNVSWSKLLVEQIEYSNVILLNKIDLVPSAEEMDKIKLHVTALNSKATILEAKHSVMDVLQVVNTNLYDASDFATDHIIPFEMAVEEKDCCKASVSRGETPCCKNARTITTDLSEVMLSSKSLPKTRHESRFGITSFVYRANRPFHSARFHENFINKYFIFVDLEDEDEDDEDEMQEVTEEDEDVKMTAAEKEEKEEENKTKEGETDADDNKKEEDDDENYREMALKELQEEAATKKQLRLDTLGTILRSKGFVWTPHTHDSMVVYGQAGNNVNMEHGENTWKVLNPKAWTEGSEEDIALYRTKFITPYGDRRQELVFIGGPDMKHEKIQTELDDCLLTNKEFALGVDGWKATIDDLFMEN
mmetsp:Transcript_13127/g.14626  ORF Transcript_13127/g.14626 Transcript_13127/m.14626 type:complete len:593 (-) Transcript_13127:105-1883(-)